MLAGYEGMSGQDQKAVHGIGSGEASPGLRKTDDDADGLESDFRANIASKRNTTDFRFGHASKQVSPERPAAIQQPISMTSPPLTSFDETTTSTQATPSRSHTVENTLAQARANALKRLEARRKEKADETGVPYTPKDMTSTPTFGSSTPQPPDSSPSKASPFERLFAPPSADGTPADSPSTGQARIALRSKYVASGLSDFSESASSSRGSASKGKYGSISSSDRRRLGRHLPRIASGDAPLDSLETPQPRLRQPSTLGRDSVVLPSSLGDTTAFPPLIVEAKAEVLQPSTSDNVQQTPTTTPSTKRRSYLPFTPKGSLSTPASGALKPRPEVAGEEMKGLMSAGGGITVQRINQ